MALYPDADPRGEHVRDRRRHNRAIRRPTSLAVQRDVECLAMMSLPPMPEANRNQVENSMAIAHRGWCERELCSETLISCVRSVLVLLREERVGDRQLTRFGQDDGGPEQARHGMTPCPDLP